MKFNFNNLVARVKSSGFSLGLKFGAGAKSEQNPRDMGQQLDQEVEDLQTVNQESAFDATTGTSEGLSVSSPWLQRD